MGAVVGAVLAGTLILLSVAAQRTSDVATARGLDRTTRLISVLLEGRERSLSRAALVFVQNPSFRTLVIDEHPNDLLDQSLEAADRAGATWVQIANARGERLAKSDEPTAARVSLSGSALITGALDGTPTSGIGASGDTLLFQAVAVPIFGTGQIAGVMMAAQAIDSALAAEVKATTVSDVVFYVLDTSGTPRIAASTIGDAPQLMDLLASANSGRASLRTDTTSQVAVELEGERYVGKVAPLRSAGGDVLGGFVALRSRDAEMAPFTTLRRRIVLAGLLGLAMAFALSYLIARSIARPVLALARATHRASQGDYSVQVDVRSPDEIGTLADAVRTMLLDLREKEALVDVLRTSRVQPAAQQQWPTDSGSLTLHAAPDEAGEIVLGRTIAKRYVITELLGTGGAGVVYKALDRELGETIAVKTVRPEVLLQDDTALERLKSEIRLARRISHRNVVRTHDLGEIGGVYFITMEYVTGTSLRALIDREGGLPVAATFAIAKQLCRALEVAHEEGIIHRDIKPQNLMVQPDGTLKVMDFGVARLVRRTSALTQVGMAVGTPEYMAPEQLLGEEVDVRADLYAAGVVLYECLTGKRPFDADSPAALIGRVLSTVPVSPHELRPTIPLSLSNLVMRVISRDAASRPASAALLYDELVSAES